ncbi:TadE family protein [Microbacterium sp. SS28]|uniref:TadE family protein n=1 Tax=Microbacterium sp. SS28 TaxID=2919948 RepID=UPI001FAAE9F1|nr:TadE family protein [Microbacterium sp. SS28]
MRRSNPSTERALGVDPRDRVEQDDPERGAAVLEFILVGLVLLVPLVYLVVTLGILQEQALGAEAGARHIARAVSTASGPDDARARADRVMAAVADEYGMDGASVDLALECVPRGAECPEAGATIVVTLRAQARLPLVPSILGLGDIAVIPVEASSAQKVSRFWGAG